MSPRTAATAMASTPGNPRKEESSSSSSSSFFSSLKCGCSNAKAVSVSIPRRPAAASLSGRHHPHALSARLESSSGDTITLTTATTSTTHGDEVVADDDRNGSPSFSGLLRELSELERSVIAWDRRRQIPSGWRYTNETGEACGGEDTRRRAHDAAGDKAGGGRPGKDHKQTLQKHPGRHRRSQSEGDYGAGAVGLGVGDVVAGRMGGSVAVVTETEDPLGEFRRSMLQMIVEEDIVCPQELQELLRRFLALNSPSHHRLIVRAFADIWRDVFSGDFVGFPHLIPPVADHPHRNLRRQYSYHGHRRY